MTPAELYGPLAGLLPGLTHKDKQGFILGNQQTKINGQPKSKVLNSILGLKTLCFFFFFSLYIIIFQ